MSQVSEGVRGSTPYTYTTRLSPRPPTLVCCREGTPVGCQVGGRPTKACSAPSTLSCASHWRDCHFADALSPSPLKHLLKVELGVQQDDSLADGHPAAEARGHQHSALAVGLAEGQGAAPWAAVLPMHLLLRAPFSPSYLSAGAPLKRGGAWLLTAHGHLRAPCAACRALPCPAVRTVLCCAYVCVCCCVCVLCAVLCVCGACVCGAECACVCAVRRPISRRATRLGARRVPTMPAAVRSCAAVYGETASFLLTLSLHPY